MRKVDVYRLYIFRFMQVNVNIRVFPNYGAISRILVNNANLIKSMGQALGLV